MSFKPPGQCPVCGEWVPRGAAACDSCGSCARSGWKSGAGATDGLDLPDDDFDYDRFVAEEFGQGAPPAADRQNFWRWVAAVLLIVLVLGYLWSAL